MTARGEHAARLTKRIQASESNEGYKYPHRASYPPVIIIPLLPRTSAMISPRFNFSHASTPFHSSPSIGITSPLLPPSVSGVSTLLVSRALPCTSTRGRAVASLPTHGEARHPSRSREDHRDASLRSYPTYANVVAVAVTIAAVVLVVIGSSAARINQEPADDRLRRRRILELGRECRVKDGSSDGGPVVPLARS